MMLYDICKNISEFASPERSELNIDNFTLITIPNSVYLSHNSGSGLFQLTEENIGFRCYLGDTNKSIEFRVSLDNITIETIKGFTNGQEILDLLFTIKNIIVNLLSKYNEKQTEDISLKQRIIKELLEV